MSKYTIELRELLNYNYHLALDTYPIFDENYRETLNSKIINHFYFREIGQETPDRFNFFLNRKMHEIMPYYNQLYRSELLSFDPLATDYMTTKTGQEKENYRSNKLKDRSKEAGTEGNVFTGNIDYKENVAHDETEDTIGHDEYKKQGDKTVDVTGNRKEDLLENTEGNELTTNDLQEDETTETKIDKTVTDNLQEDLTENIVSTSTTTNDLNTVTDSTNTGKGTTDTNGSKSSVFSDLPQAALTTSTNSYINEDGAAETRATVDGYATTTTTESTTEHSNTTSEETGHSETKNTGTVKVDGNSDRTVSKVNTGDVSTDESQDETRNKSNTGTVNVDTTGKKTNDNNIDTTENTQENWKEFGESDNTNNLTGKQNTDTTSNRKEDTQRNIATSSRYFRDKDERFKTNESLNLTVNQKGRKGFIPAELLKKYRETFLNIDMMIIEELEVLFMGVY